MKAEAVAPVQGGLPETRGWNLWDRDSALRALLPLYLPADLMDHVRPHLSELGGRITTELDDLAAEADRNPPVLHQRGRQGVDDPHIAFHPAYRALEQVAFGDYGLAAMSHRGGVLGWPDPMPPAVKYAFTYLFVQSEFGLCCPLSMTDALTRTLRRFGAPDLVARHIDALTSQDLDGLAQGAMFMTEQGAGSDVGASTVEARRSPDGGWTLWGEKWFCSNADAELAMVLARPEGAGPGTKGLGLFLMPARRADGTRNAYRIVRLKDKLGTRSMASGEISLQGAEAWPVGEIDQGFRQMAEMINASRLSNAVRAAGLMRRSLHEAVCVAAGRRAFGRRLDQLPLMRRSLLKLAVPTEQALSLMLYTAHAMAQADAGDAEAAKALRCLTALMKFRTCRDARKVAADAMEVRGGCGYIEEWINPRLLRDSHLGSIWEGTSNIVALDVLRGAGKLGAPAALAARIGADLDAHAPDDALAAEAKDWLARAVAFVDRAAGDERLARQAASALYSAASVGVMALEAARLGGPEGARRAALARLTVTHRLAPRDPLAADDEDAGFDAVFATA